ncbi:5,6-dimethylbenzimidazole synthase [Rhodoligotrophos appendicifer]|uniref:5,6-dimethylbenzimidazole synthase n=1 Tax=Rhodoligotrophos appendicifer TaxID=987056 RepID=UPI00118669AA|nr:5,6-dimethylbenzimidazole synthase [Rhodoligotrophos appendicifer]
MTGGSRQGDAEFTAEERDAVYRCIFDRRDVRGQFLGDEVPDEVLGRILKAAHRAPSVGFMQPWDFIILKDQGTKQRIRDAFQVAHEEAAGQFEGDRQSLYKSLKLEGITEAPIGLCVTCDRERSGRAVLGRTHQAEMDLYSAVCAVQNLWLAARAENVGVGWVSILRYDDLREILGIPDRVQPIAYLCIGYVSHFLDKPELETRGWLPRMKLDELVWFDRWQERSGSEPLLEQLR